MKKILKEELPEVLAFKTGRTGWLRLNLLQLQIGEGLFLPKAEWKPKNPPYKVVAYIKKTQGYIFEYGLKADSTGWLFRRVK